LVSEFDDLDRRAMMSIIDIGIKIDIKRRERNHIVDIITN
jgi:hypothetical protein